MIWPRRTFDEVHKFFRFESHTAGGRVRGQCSGSRELGATHRSSLRNDTYLPFPQVEETFIPAPSRLTIARRSFGRCATTSKLLLSPFLFADSSDSPPRQLAPPVRQSDAVSFSPMSVEF